MGLTLSHQVEGKPFLKKKKKVFLRFKHHPRWWRVGPVCGSDLASVSCRTLQRHWAWTRGHWASHGVTGLPVACGGQTATPLLPREDEPGPGRFHPGNRPRLQHPWCIQNGANSQHLLFPTGGPTRKPNPTKQPPKTKKQNKIPHSSGPLILGH